MAVASTVEAVDPSAMTFTSPPYSVTVLPPLISASFLLSAMFSASEPAIPIFPPLAPEIASAPIVPTVSPATSVLFASTVSHLALIVDPLPIVA